MQQQLLTEVLETLTDLFDSVERIDDHNGWTRFRGSFTVESIEVRTRVLFGVNFPLTLPVFKLEPWDALGHIPHVSPSGLICFLSPEGTVLDESRPGIIVRDAFARMQRLLLDGVAGINRDDFVDEFEACWSYLDSRRSLFLVSSLGRSVETLDIDIGESGGGFVGRNAHAIGRLFPHGDAPQQYRRDAVLYLPLEPGSFIRPPSPDESFWSAADLTRIIVGQLSKNNREALERLLRRQRTTGEFLLISLPRPKGGESLFGITFKGTEKVHPLLPNGVAEEIGPAIVRRLDPVFLLGRGGADTEVRQKKILIVGCGSLGGRIAIELSRTGISAMTLVDPDQMEPENTFRHVLGRLHWFKNKASALKDVIEMQTPYICVTAIDQTIEQALSTRRVQFERFDLVVFATGNPTVELRMNHVLASLRTAPPAVFSWLEPLGIGGHALLVQASSQGCFRCLYEDSYDPDIGIYNKSAFAGPGQAFGRALSGCGSLFTPFSSLDAASTAVLASRLAMDALTGREIGNPLLSWKGDATEFTTAGFELSARFGRSDQHLFDNRYAYQAEGCPVCGDRIIDAAGHG